MATTISTSQTYDSAARTAGDTYTINSGAIFTIDSDTRDGKNAPGSRAGSMGSFTMTATTGGKVLLDGSKVWLIKYDGLIGTPNVPALGTIIAGVTSGAYGELMNISSAINATPTAAGSAMPATGYIKLKSKTGTFQDNETLEIQSSTDLCLANGVGMRGWIEVVMDDAAGFTIGRAQTFQVRGDWFVSETTASGSAQQQVQFPNFGGTNFFLPGCWVETGNGTNVWEFWPAFLAGTGSPWATTALGTDARSKFCQCLAGGILRFGGDGTNAIGMVPVSGARFRVPNVFLKSAATASRASDSVPNATLATRPDFTTTNAGIIDVEYAIGHWQMNLSQAYSVKLYHFALFDNMTLSEIASALDLSDGGSGLYGGIATDAANFNITSCLAGGTVVDWKTGRSGTIAASDYGTIIQYCKNITFTRCHFQNRTFRTNAGGHPLHLNYCDGITLTDCVAVGASFYINVCLNTTLNTPLYADSYHTTSSATTPPVGAIQLMNYTYNTKVDGFNWYTSVANVHPDTAVIYLSAAIGVKLRNMGTFASKISAGSSNAMLNFLVDLGNSSNIEIKRCYFDLIATSMFNVVNSTKGLKAMNCTSNPTSPKNLISAAMDQLIMNVEGASIAPASAASIYGSIFYHHFTSSSAGRLGLKFNEPTALYAPYVTTSFSSSSTGTSGFDSAGGLALINSGDYAIFEFPELIQGIDSFPSSAPTITTSTNMDISYQIKLPGGSWSDWKAFSAANLSGESINATTGFYFKIKAAANATAAANILTVVYCLTSSNSTAQAIEYSLDTITLTLTGLQAGSDVVVLAAGTSTERINVDANAGTTYGYVYSSQENIDIGIFKAGYTPFYIRNYALGSADASIPVAQTEDRYYLL